jgi:hypothetical protein
MKILAGFLLFIFIALGGGGSAFAQTSPLTPDSGDAVSVSVYPNPAAEFIQFDCKIASAVPSPRLVVNNVLGASVAEVDIDADEPKVKLAVSEWKSGVYFYTIFSGNKALYTRKFVVKH